MPEFDTLNSRLLSIDEQHPIGLAYGKMGTCLYFFYLSRWEGKDGYRQVAKKILDEIIVDMPSHRDVSVEKGLAGIAMGLSHLVKEKFVGGDINEILDEVDSHIFKSLAFLNTVDACFPKPVLIHLLYYFCLRYADS